MNFKIDDLVLFSEGKPDSVWMKGRITGNNFAMCNCSDYFDAPAYDITITNEDISDNNTITDKPINNLLTYTIPSDSKYILPYKIGYAWCIGQNCHTCTPYNINDCLNITSSTSSKDDLFEMRSHNTRKLIMFDTVIAKIKDKYVIDLFVSYNDDNTITTMYNGVASDWYAYSDYEEIKNNKYTIKCGDGVNTSSIGKPIEIPETKIICPCDNNETLKEILETLKTIQSLLSFRGGDDPYAPYGPMKIWYSTDKTIPDMNKGWRYQPGPYCGDLTGCKHNNYNYYTTATNKID